MVKGTPSKGKKSKGRAHMRCRRCGRFAYNITKRVCSACGFGRSEKVRGYNWGAKKVNRVRKPKK